MFTEESIREIYSKNVVGILPFLDEDEKVSISKDLSSSVNHKNLFVEYFQFCHIDLNNFTNLWNHPDLKVYFSDKNNSPKAWKLGPSPLFVRINKPLIEEIYSLIEAWDFLIADHGRYLGFECNLHTINAPFNVKQILKEVVNKFIFFHEKCHLYHLQNLSVFNKDGLCLSTDDPAKFDQQRHAIELNADEFAVYMLLDHIHQLYIIPLQKRTDLRQRVNYVLCLSVAAIAILFALIIQSKMKNNIGFYISEWKYPHPITRIYAIVRRIVHEYNSNLEHLFGKGTTESNFNELETLDQVLKICTAITENHVSFNIFDEFYSITIPQEGNIIDYLNSIYEYSKDKDFIFKRPVRGQAMF
ncbi:hypothetical protein GVN16_02850 [Emticicia sp. CRIBPO]|uniref:hypothetical protein n=1 Tax=Emticicia sp. CRIBPO TaxID=2683258 RepID=UPI001411CB23|nr:hypothetical protein [Emticicia sp. CRIBPO]NBA84679.1 hypothetical protein [Emticicia sp. CRIBPO]